VLALACLLAVAACASNSGGGSSGSLAPSGASSMPSIAPTATPLMSDGPMTGPADAGSPSPALSTPVATTSPNPAAAALAARAWATASLIDVTTGQPFTIAGLAGRTIFVEAMAIWCTKCREQQTRFAEALKRLDPARVAYVVLTVDPAETATALAKYKADRGFSGLYAVAGKAVSSALAADFGANVLNPPSVPLVHVTPTGQITFTTGGETVDQIIALVGS